MAASKVYTKTGRALGVTGQDEVLWTLLDLMVQWLRHHNFTVGISVRFRLGLLYIFISNDNRQYNLDYIVIYVPSCNFSMD
jgi:hypothetical protein